MPVEIATEDLLLREFAAVDWPAVHAYAMDPEVVRYELWGPNDEEQSRSFVEGAIRASRESPRQTYELAVVLRETGALVGGAGIRIRDVDHREGDIGYVLRKDHWGRGLGTQVARALVRFGFERLDLHRIWATCEAENVASAKVLGRAGMRQEGRLRSNRLQRGVWRDTLLFAILETDHFAFDRSGRVALCSGAEVP